MDFELHALKSSYRVITRCGDDFRKEIKLEHIIMGYGVIGNTTVSGTVILGSSPGIPANILVQDVTAPSYSGLVLRPLTAATPVQIRLGSQAKIPRFE